MIRPEKVLRFSIILILLTVIFSGLLYFLFDFDSIHLLNKTQLCVFRIITGKKCPGCGMTHAFLSIGKLQIVESFKYNIFALPFFIFMILYIIFPKIKTISQNKILIYSILFLAIVYWIVRNL